MILKRYYFPIQEVNIYTLFILSSCHSILKSSNFILPLQVPGNLIISARSAPRSFDSSKMNMSHVVSHFSVGYPMNENSLNRLKRRLPYIRASPGRLDGKSFITPHNIKENVTVSFGPFSNKFLSLCYESKHFLSK